MLNPMAQQIGTVSLYHAVSLYEAEIGNVSILNAQGRNIAILVH